MVGGSLARDQKKADEQGYTIVFVDEAGFYLLPMAVRTWAPRAHTPVLPVKLTHAHVSALGGITPDGRLFLQFRPQAYDGDAVVAYLQMLHRKLHGKILVIWDGAPIHRSKVLKTYLAAGATKWLWLERLPGYAPDLNPQEGIWNYLKRVELRNVCCTDLDHLTRHLVRARERLRHRSPIIIACFHECGYHFSNLPRDQ